MRWALPLIFLIFTVAGCGSKASSPKKINATQVPVDTNSSLAAVFELACEYKFEYSTAGEANGAGANSGTVPACTSTLQSSSGQSQTFVLSPTTIACEIPHAYDFFQFSSESSDVAVWACGATDPSGAFISLKNKITYSCFQARSPTASIPLPISEVTREQDLIKQGAGGKPSVFEITIPMEQASYEIPYTCPRYYLGTPPNAQESIPFVHHSIKESASHPCLKLTFADDVTDDSGALLPFVETDPEAGYIRYRVYATNTCN